MFYIFTGSANTNITPINDKNPTPLSTSSFVKRPSGIGLGIYQGSQGLFYCDYCSYSSAARTLVSKHRKTHFSYRPYGCVYCQFQAFCRTRIHTHCKKVHPEKVFRVRVFEKPAKLTLSVLDKRLDRSLFTSEELLAGDEDTRNTNDETLDVGQSEDIENETSYSCNECEGMFDTMELLEDHKHTFHLSNHLCKCYYCEIIMSDVSSMREHLVEYHVDDEALYIDVNSGQVSPSKNRLSLHAKGKHSS